MLFILLILLLPLRGWVGDAMAMQMVLPGGSPHAADEASHGTEHHQAAQRADHRHGTGVGLSSDCADHAAADAASLDSHCQTCTTCQVCHTLAINLRTTVLPVSEPAHPLPPLAVQPFANADRAPGLKPPIS